MFFMFFRAIIIHTISGNSQWGSARSRFYHVSCSIILVIGALVTARAESFSKADSGWVPLFNGKDFEGLYSRLYNKPVTTTVDPAFRIRYAGTDSAEIDIEPIGGEIGTQRADYSHYRMRVQYRFEKAGKLNAGLLYAVDETYPRMGGDGTVEKGNWPRGIESQMKQGDGGDAFSIQQVAFNTRVNGLSWDPNGKDVTVCESGCNRRAYSASPDKADYPGPAWNDMEVVVRGADSARHIVNGKVVFKLWNIRIADKKGKTLQKWDKGALGLEAEGSAIHYRRWEVMELPESGPDYIYRVLLQKPTQGETIQAESDYTITWKSIGDFSEVKLQYQTTADSWKTIADKAPNSGKYIWKVPKEASTKLRVKVSGIPTWVMADTSGVNTLAVITAVKKGKRLHQHQKTGGIMGSERDLKGRAIPESRLKSLGRLP